ncbi:hypothetical protein PPACK8108_LOCUS15801, partial [Phakopsora pachyrhizi]
MPLQLNRNNKLRQLTDYDWQEAKSLKEFGVIVRNGCVDAGDYYGFEGFEDDYCDDDIQQMNLQADGSEIDDVDGVNGLHLSLRKEKVVDVSPVSRR